MKQELKFKTLKLPRDANRAAREGLLKLLSLLDIKSLAAFLGFTEDEYALWVEQPEALKSILFCRTHDIQLGEASEWKEAHRVAARSQGAGDAGALLEWLKKTGRLD